MGDPIAFFLTWPTYGTWLPGDERGWVEYGQGWQLPDPIRILEAAAKMTEDACRLTPQQRQLVEEQIAETCRFRGWVLYAVNCRSNHLHVVVGAKKTTARKIRNDLKAWCTRKLKANDSTGREHWWAERGSIRAIFDDEGLFDVVVYVAETQDRKRDEN